jgi:putative addiction module killer protein
MDRNVIYMRHMYQLKQTGRFSVWLAALRDKRALGRITVRLLRAQAGLLGDVKSVGGQVSEMRIDYGPGYRLYFTRRGAQLIILLCGGDKGSQARDISLAQQLAGQLNIEGDVT